MSFVDTHTYTRTLLFGTLLRCRVIIIAEEREISEWLALILLSVLIAVTFLLLLRVSPPASSLIRFATCSISVYLGLYIAPAQLMMMKMVRFCQKSI